MRSKLFFALALLSAPAVWAQLVAPNSVGATIGHVHLNVRDIDAQERFWLQLGGKRFPYEKLLPQRVIEFPGIYILLRRQDANGGSAGSTIDHIGFSVKNFAEWLPKWQAAGFKMHIGTGGKGCMITGPDDVRVEIKEDPSISTPIAMQHVHLFLPYAKAAQAWYAKVFGAVPGSRPGGKYLTATVPGTEITFTNTDAAQAPTKGRALDHIGFDFKNLDQFVKRLAELGVQIEYPVRANSVDANVTVTHITDPWGTRIELTGGSPRLTSLLR